MKTISFIFFLSFCWTINAQDQTDDLKTANQEIYMLTDSLWNLEKLYVNKSIDEKTYLKISGELLSALSAMAYSNASNYTRASEKIPETPVETTPEPPMPESKPVIEPMDTVPQEHQMEEMQDFSPPKNPISLITGSGRRTSFKLRYGLFWNGLSQGKSQQNIKYPTFKLWNSFCWFSEIDLLMQSRLGKSNKGPWSIYYGIGLDYRKLTQKNNPQPLSLDPDNKAVFVTLIPSDSLEKASINLSYFRIPVGLQFKKKKLCVNIGGYFGFLTNHEQTLEYSTTLDEKAQLILDKNYNFEKTIYGLSASIGIKRVHLAFNYDLNTLFKKNDDYEYNAWKIGLMIF